MRRDTFIKQSGSLVFGLAAFGNIKWSNGHYVGDSLTTTDILGPYYRPGAPFRNNLNPQNFSGQILHLSGTVYQQDRKTPARGCKIEAWQCRPDGYYDNISQDYSYRGYTLTDGQGNYKFLTMQPPPEPTDETNSVYRPAHIHLRISAKRQQDLITQIYFSGDELLPTDPSTRSLLAINRILPVMKTNEKEDAIRFDVVLGQIRGALAFSGNSLFAGMNTEARFTLNENETVTVHFEFLRRKATKLDGKKILSYE